MIGDKYDYVLRFGNHPIDWEVAETLFQATDAIPGSPEKVEILKKRAALRQPLFHPHDRVNFLGIGLIQNSIKEKDE